MQVTTPPIISQPFANGGEAATIPDSKQEFGRASWNEGFPTETALPLNAGGMPPHKADFNGVLKALSQHAFFGQSGCVYPWNVSLNYLVASHVVGSDGNEYMAKAASGPDTTSGADVVGPKNPVDDADGEYWINVTAKLSGGSGGGSTINLGDAITFSRPTNLTCSRTEVIIPEGTSVLIGSKGYTLAQQKVISLDTVASAATRKGKDIYIFAVEKPGSGGATDVDFILSMSNTFPAGYNPDNSRKIGGLHCLCANVGAIANHPLSGFVAGDILPATLWDLWHFAEAGNEGMAYHEGLRKWVDIYLASWNGTKLVSAFGAATADGTSSPAFHGELFVERFGQIGKRLPMRDEFVVFAKGSNENTAIAGAADAVTAGGHNDSAGRRMISDIGLEDCCGFLWQWTRDSPEYLPGTTIKSNQYGYYIGDYSWRDTLYNASVDSQRYGQCFGFLRRLLVGGHWVHSSYCGSRCVLGNHASTYANPSFGARGLSEPGRAIR